MLAPTNEKSLFAFLCNQLAKIESGNYNRDEIEDIVKVTNKIDKQLDREITRLREESKAAEINHRLGTLLKMRELASKGFDDTTNLR